MEPIKTQKQLLEALLHTLTFAEVTADEIMTCVCDVFIRSILGIYPRTRIDDILPLVQKTWENYLTHPECIDHVEMLLQRINNNRLDA